MRSSGIPATGVAMRLLAGCSCDVSFGLLHTDLQMFDFFTLSNSIPAITTSMLFTRAPL